MKLYSLKIDDFCIIHADLLTAKSLEQIIFSINEQLTNIPEFET